MRHGLTIGEVARLRLSGMPWGGPRFARPIEGDLTVVPMRGWRRAMNFVEAGLPWVMPSPNMPTPATALVYPGQCLFEATNLSEGRGTTRPFEIVGAPFLDGYDWAAALTRSRRSCRCRACGFGRSRSGPCSTSSPAARAVGCSCT